jgi:hypothetical protein
MKIETAFAVIAVVLALVVVADPSFRWYKQTVNKNTLFANQNRPLMSHPEVWIPHK